MLRQATKLRSIPAQQFQSVALYSAQAAEASNPYYNVPEGHINSDLSPEVCNIGLNRRRELTLGAAGNVKLCINGQHQRLADLFKTGKSLIFGVPDCGKVCSEKHVPQYMAEFDNLRKQGIEKIFCVAVGDVAIAEKWAKKNNIDGTKVTLANDINGGFTRLLGVEIGQPDSPGPRSQRYAGIIEDGVLLRICVDKSPGECKESSAPSMVKLLIAMQQNK